MPVRAPSGEGDGPGRALSAHAGSSDLATGLSDSRDRLMKPEAAAEDASNRSVAILGLLAISIMAPVTLPVPILRELVGVRFEVSELLTSLFMSVNMIGASRSPPERRAR